MKMPKEKNKEEYDVQSALMALHASSQYVINIIYAANDMCFRYKKKQIVYTTIIIVEYNFNRKTQEINTKLNSHLS